MRNEAAQNESYCSSYAICDANQAQDENSTWTEDVSLIEMADDPRRNVLTASYEK
jgi:hypothetical protein